MTYKDEDNDINYHDHTFMASGSSILDDNWILDSNVCCSIIKDHDLFIEYISLSKLITFSAASGDLLIIYKISMVRICMEYMNIDIKKIYYILTIIINLLCAKELFIASYQLNL